MIDTSMYAQLGKVPQIQGPMELATQAQQLRNLAGHGQMQDLQLRQANQSAMDEEAIRKAASESGGNVETLKKRLLNIGTPGAIGAFHKISQTEAETAQKKAAFQKTYLEMGKEEQTQIDSLTDLVGNAARAAKAAKPDEQAPLWAQSLDALSQRLMPNEYDTPRLAQIKQGMIQQMQAEKQALVSGQGPLRLDEHINSSKNTKDWVAETKATSDLGKLREDLNRGLISEKDYRDAVRRHNTVSSAVNINLGTMKPGEAGFDDAVEATKKKLLTGQMPFPKGRELSDPVNNKAVKLARIEDPGFNEATHAERAKAWSNLSNGPIGKSNNAINTAIAHLGKLTDLYKELSDTGVVGLNHTMNWLKKNAPGGYPALDEAETVINAVGDELEKAYTGTGTEGGRKAWREKLDPSLPMASRMRNAIGLIDLLEGKIKANSSQFKKAFGGMDPGISVLTPESEETLEKIKTWAKGKTASPSGKSNPQPDKPAAQAKVLSEAELGKLPPSVASAYKSGKAIKGPDGTVYKKGE